MFWVWILLSMLGYSVQNVLMARYIRRIEVLSAGFYRSVTFFVSFLPVLLFVPPEAYAQISEYALELLLASVLGAASQWSRFLSVRYLPVGVASSGTMGFNVLLSWGLGYLFFAEVLTLPILVCLLVILAGSITLTLLRQNFDHLDSTKATLGAGMVFLTSILISMALFLVGKVSRELDPFLTSYLWEAGIAIAALTFIGLRWCISGQGLEKVSWRTLGLIGLCASPTVIGTVGFAIAVKMGPLAIVSAVSATGVIVITLLSAWIYHEKLRWRHYAVIGVTVLAVIALRLIS